MNKKKQGFSWNSWVKISNSMPKNTVYLCMGINYATGFSQYYEYKGKKYNTREEVDLFIKEEREQKDLIKKIKNGKTNKTRTRSKKSN